MSNLSPKILRIITCTVSGSGAQSYANRVHGMVMSGENADLGEMSVAAVSGALYGIFAGLILDDRTQAGAAAVCSGDSRGIFAH